MNNEEKKLQRQQDQARVDAARKALDEGNAKKALSFLDEVSECWSQNLITLMGVVGFHSEKVNLANRATSLFYQHLKLCTNVKILSGPALWLRNPKRARSIPLEFKLAIDNRRRQLQPDWDGVWLDPGLGSSNKIPIILTKQPNEVFDAKLCLGAAEQAKNWDPWIQRYQALGGDCSDPKYFKFWAAKIVSAEHKKPSPKHKAMLKKFAASGDISEVRSFLRNITPI